MKTYEPQEKTDGAQKKKKKEVNVRRIKDKEHFDC